MANLCFVLLIEMCSRFPWKISGSLGDFCCLQSFSVFCELQCKLSWQERCACLGQHSSSHCWHVANIERSLRVGFCLQRGIYLCAVSAACFHPSWCDGQTLSFLLASLLWKGGIITEKTLVSTFGEVSGLSFSSFIGYDGVMMAHKATQPWKCSPCWTY